MTYSSSQAEKPTRVAAPKSSAHKKNDKSPITTKPKRKTLATGMKDELIRVARLTAERLVDANVAFAPTKEDWMPKKLYREAGTSYLLGHVTRYNIESKTNADNISVPSAAFQICWTSTAFQKKEHVHKVSESVVMRGIRNFVTLQKGSLQFGESWTSLCSAIPQLTNIVDFSDDYEEVDEQSSQSSP
ncbi:hypothetical protein L916_20369 [Phytophthora nicotianae]|uniref:Uncharacterized protein n=1 Tax=Phytophthora nicotianae TaxID=4792 RepID=W2HV74_PHYNI|nr:hypothetical protein L916_20369 [Phytophthora nicotianae]